MEKTLGIIIKTISYKEGRSICIGMHSDLLMEVIEIKKHENLFNRNPN